MPGFPKKIVLSPEPGDSIDNPVLPLLSRTKSSPFESAVTVPALDEYT